MGITLTPRTEEMIRQKIEEGRFSTPDEVIEEALHALDERDRLQELRAKLQTGIDQLDRGEGVTFTPEWSASRARIAHERAAEGETPHPDVRS
jgi:antitoxin ParD1/3/4